MIYRLHLRLFPYKCPFIVSVLSIIQSKFIWYLLIH